MKRSYFVIIAFIIFAAPGLTQSINMFPLGTPEGSQVKKFTINHEGIILTVEENGTFYRSKDNGNTWNIITEQAKGTDFPITYLRDGSFFYIGKEDNSLYRISKDSENPEKLTVEPKFHYDYIFSLWTDKEDNLYALNLGTVYKSENGGTTWNREYNFYETIPPNLTVDFTTSYTPEESDYIYFPGHKFAFSPAFHIVSQLHRLKKDGKTFELVFEKEIPLSKIGLYHTGKINTLRHSSGQLIVATHAGAYAADENSLQWETITPSSYNFNQVTEGKNGELIFVENDGYFVAPTIGASLTALPSPNPGIVFSESEIKTNPVSGDYLVKETNALPFNLSTVESNFSKWKPLSPSPTPLNTEEVAFKTQRGNLYIKTPANTGYFISRDAGETFTSLLINDKLSIESLIKGNFELLIAAASDGKIYRSTDEGQNWTIIQPPGELLKDHPNRHFLLKKGKNGEILADFYDGTQRLWYSNTNGSTWQRINAGYIDSERLKFHPSGDLFGLFYSRNTTNFSDSAELIRYNPTFREWTKVKTIAGQVDGLSISNRGLIRFRTAISHSNFRTLISDDAGQNLTEAEMPEFYTSEKGFLFATSDKDILMSKNDGLTWETIYTHDNNTPYKNLYLGPENRLHAAFATGPIFQSTPLSLNDNFIIGDVSLDDNFNCVRDTSEQAHPYVIVRAEGPDTFYVTTRLDGKFIIPVPQGSYDVSVSVNPNYWIPCDSLQQVNFSSTGDTTFIDFPLHRVVDCPGMQVDLTVSEITDCTSNVHFVNYCNKGTKDAVDASVDITLHPNFTISAADIPWTAISGNTYTFPIGNVKLFECSDFSFTTVMDCDSVSVGDSICFDAHIFPDSVCIPNSSAWSGASLEFTGECTGDSIKFKVKNAAGFDMGEPRQYVVIEDILLMKVSSPFQLLANDSITFSTKSNGFSYHIEVNQLTGHPGVSNPNLTLLNCSTTNTSNFSLVDKFGHDDLDPFTDTECTVVATTPTVVTTGTSRFRYRTENHEKTEEDINLKNITIENSGIKVYPNPFSYKAILRSNSDKSGADFKCQLYDSYGKLIRTQTSHNQQITLNREELLSGTYFYIIITKNGTTTSGKIIVQ